jgi:PAS domain S-box-containing protein
MIAEVRANVNSLTAAMDDRDFRRLAENMPILCWIADATGYIQWYNPRWYEYTGTTPAQMEGWGWQSVHEPKNLAAVLDSWRAAISAGRPFEMVFPIRGADGVFRPFLTRINPAFDAHGAITNWFGVNIDVSRQVEAEAAFAQSEAKFRVLADSMPQIVWSATPEGKRDYFNARWYDYTGLPVGSGDGPQGGAALVHPEDRERVRIAWRTALAAGEPCQMEYRLRRHCGAYRWHLTRAHPERDAQGRVSGWYGTLTDIEEIVQARSVLQKSRAALEAEVAARTGERNLLATLVEKTDVMIMALDLDFNILAINPANEVELERLYGVRGRAGDNLLALLADQPAMRAAAEATWRRGFEDEDAIFVEAHGDPDGHWGQYEIKFGKLRNDAGEVVGAFNFVTDVTARLREQAMLAQAQEALRQAQKLESMGQLTGGVAHDFNNLLTPILGTLDLLLRRGVGGEREQRLIRGASQSAERAKTLVQRLLAFARRQPLQATTIDVGALVTGLAELLISTIGPNVTVTVDIDPDLPPAKADPHQLEMALINLGVNARDAMDGGGRLRIAAARATVAAGEVPGLAAGVYVRLSMHDTGKGMDEATQARAIEPFFSTKGVGQGTGLGLSMAHGLASQLGGALTIESTPGQGAEVIIWLPESLEPAEAAAEAAVAQAGAQGGGLVLLVDDEEYIRVITADMLAELGYKVHAAESAAAALEALKDGLAPDVVMTDHLMPGMTGVELAYAVRTDWPAVKILVVSGFAEVDGLDPTLPRLTKPFVQSELAASLAGLDCKGRPGAPPLDPAKG